jgi:hypothetical protein
MRLREVIWKAVERLDQAAKKEVSFIRNMVAHVIGLTVGIICFFLVGAWAVLSQFVSNPFFLIFIIPVFLNAAIEGSQEGFKFGSESVLDETIIETRQNLKEMKAKLNKLTIEDNPPRP